jgi:hypothetical protein
MIRTFDPDKLQADLDARALGRRLSEIYLRRAEIAARMAAAAKAEEEKSEGRRWLAEDDAADVALVVGGQDRTGEELVRSAVLLACLAAPIVGMLIACPVANAVIRLADAAGRWWVS